jgi:hypothetical protein
MLLYELRDFGAARPPETHPWCRLHIYLCEVLGLSARPLMGPGRGGRVPPPSWREDAVSSATLPRGRPCPFSGATL